MERGELGFENRPTTVFVFEGLIAHLTRPRMEKTSLRLRRWEAALDWWDFDTLVCDYIYGILSRFVAEVEVMTWRPSGFAAVLHDRLWSMDIPVTSTRSAESYLFVSQHIATDPRITTVYDADPAHRFGYGFKCRDFVVGQT